MNCLKLSYSHSAELKIISSKKVLTSKKSENKVRSDYMFGFNGQMKVNEIAGVGNHNTAEFWEYDTRLGRRWNLDPVETDGVSPYAVNLNNPILYNDPDGDCPWCFGALAGMAIDAAMQGVAIYTGVQDEFSWSSIGISAVAGATGVGLSGVVEKGVARMALQGATKAVVSTAVDIAANTVLGVGEDVAKDYAADGKIDNDIDIGGNVAQAIGAKIIGDVVEGVVKKGIANAPEAKQLEKQAKRLERKAANNPKESPNTNRNKQPKEARAKYNSHVSGRATKAGIIAGGGGGAASKESYNRSHGINGGGSGNTGVGKINPPKPCFVAGTLVATNKGYAVIEQVKDGDSVLTYSIANKRLEYQIVKEKHQSITDSIVTLILPNGEKIETTPIHSFYVNEGKWIPAGQLTTKDIIWFSNGTKGNIKQINTVARQEVVYNFEVPVTHNYFVSKGKILVHNSEGLTRQCK